MRTYKIVEGSERPMSTMMFPITVENLTKDPAKGDDEKTTVFLRVRFVDTCPVSSAKDAAETIQEALEYADEYLEYAAAQSDLKAPGEGEVANDFKITVGNPAAEADTATLFVRTFGTKEHSPICGTRDMALVTMADAFDGYDGE